MSEQNNNFLYENFDFKNSSIIQPPTKNPENKIATKQKYILIDSRDRNINTYPNNNKFTIKLDEVIKDVLEIELISAYVPNTGYTINQNNSFIYSSIDMSGSPHVNNETAGLLGYWTSAEKDIIALLTILGQKFCGGSSTAVSIPANNVIEYSNPITAAPDPIINAFIRYSFRTKKITIKPNTNIYFVDSSKNYLTKSMGELLGFRENIITATTIADTTPVTATTPLNFSQNDYILLHLENFERFEGRISNNNAVENAYAKLHLGNGTRNVFFGRIKAFTNALSMNPTLQKLDRFDIKFTDYYGNLYDFNNGDLSLTFAITYKSQPGYFDF
jgi:hypothetical protein